jgi:hypothetical protein
MAQVEKTEFEFPDEIEEKQSRVGSKVVAVEDKPEIEVVDDTPEADRGRKPMMDPPKDPTEEELSKYDEGVKKRIQHFTKGYHEERRAKEAAQREKEEALRLAEAVVEENKKLRGSLSENNAFALEQAKKVVENELAVAKRAYKEAADAFDSDAMLAAQEAITAASIKADKIANFRPAPLQEQETVVQPRQSQQETASSDPELNRWRAKNDWFGSDKKMTAYALGVHEDLLSEGVVAGSKQYYERLDADLHARFPEKFEKPDDDAPTQRRANVVAPVTRSTAPRKIVLSQSQVNIAKRLGVPLELYARKVAEEMRNVK